MDKIALFEGKEIYKIWHGGRWFFAVNDVVSALSGSKDVRQYIKKMKARNNGLNVNWGTICTPLDVLTSDGKKRKANCSDTEGILRIIQSIPSKKAEPFKRWLAKVGRERIDEINDPQLAMERMKLTYERKGHSKEWIDKRLRGMAVRNDLTDEWKKRGVKRPLDYAILTNEIMEGTFGLKVSDYKNLKGLKRENLRDHMTDLETILTMLGEATTTKLTRDRDSQNFDNLKEDAKDGGGVAGEARSSIERLSGQAVVTNENYLDGGDLIKQLT